MNLRLNRALDGLPPLATDDELLTWSANLLACPERPDPTSIRRPAPLRATRAVQPPTETTIRLTDEDLFREIADRATACLTG